MFTIKWGICTNKGDNSILVFARIMPLSGRRNFNDILISKFKREQRPHISEKKQVQPNIGTRMLCPCCLME